MDRTPWDSLSTAAKGAVWAGAVLLGLAMAGLMMLCVYGLRTRNEWILGGYFAVAVVLWAASQMLGRGSGWFFYSLFMPAMAAPMLLFSYFKHRPQS